VIATRAGRRVETQVRRGVVESARYAERLVIRTARFHGDRVLALVNSRAADDGQGG